MEKIQRAVDYADYLIETAKQRPSQLYNKQITSTTKGKSIHQRLLELYVEECGKQTDDQKFFQASNLLPKLVKRDNLNCLILKLYPGNEGYSLMLRGRSGMESETFKMPYEVSELLEYVDSSELPPFLADLLERAQVNVFYSGCVVVEVRDYRRSACGSFDAQYVLLKPSQQSLLSDIYNMTNDGHRWTQEDINTLESQLLLTTEEPICLDPSPTVLLVANRLQYDRKKWNTPLIKRSVRKYTQAAANRKRKFAAASAPKELKLHDFLQKKKTRTNPPVNLKVGKPHVDMWKQKPVQLAVPETVDVERFATALDPHDVSSENVMELIEEHTLERDINQEKKLLAKLSINKRRSDEVYFGKLYLDHDYKDKSQGKTCTFTLGTRHVCDKYLQQFKEIFTEEGRRAVKITTQKPGQPPQIEYTPTSLTTSNQGITGPQAVMRQTVTNLSATITTTQPSDQQTTTSAAGLLTGKRNVPIQLSLTIAPAAPGGASQAANQLQLNIQKQPTATQSQQVSHRAKPGHFTSGQRSVPNTPEQSPASTPTTGQTQQFPPGLTTVTSVHSVKTPIPTPTPPPNTTITTPVTSVRKQASGADNPTISQLPHGLQQGNITFVQTTEGSTSQTLNQPITNINIANIGLPPNIIQNITNIQGMNITNLQGLQNMQVSLSVPGGGIAVPVPLSLINTNAGVLQNPTGVFVSSLPSSVSSSSSSSSATTGTTPGTNSQNTTAVTAPSIATMVTAVPSLTSTSTTSSSVVTSGLGTTPTSVITAPGMLSLPIGSIGLGPFVSGIKPQPGTSIRAPTTLPLLQIQGQPGLQLLGVQQPRAPLKTGTATLSQPGKSAGASLSTTAVLSAQGLAGHQVTTLSQLKPGQPGAGSIQPQLMQLQATPLFKNQQPLQLHPIQLKPPTQQTQPPGGTKPKSKKRTTPTPPKY